MANQVFIDTLYWGFKLFYFKLIVVLFLQVRARLVSKNFGQPEDSKGLAMFYPMLKASMGAFGPLVVDVGRCNEYIINCLSQEVPTVIMLFFWSSQANFPAWALRAFTVFVYSRLAHGTFYLLEMQPFRTLSYLPSFAVMAVIAVFPFLG